MRAHQERVFAEKKELDTKIGRLEDFCAGSVIKNLTDREQDLLKQQLVAMRIYSDILAKRIALF